MPIINIAQDLDSDGDGIPDSTDPDDDSDSDHDGFSNALEFSIGTNMHNADDKPM